MVRKDPDPGTLQWAGIHGASVLSHSPQSGPERRHCAGRVSSQRGLWECAQDHMLPFYLRWRLFWAPLLGRERVTLGAASLLRVCGFIPRCLRNPCKVLVLLIPLLLLLGKSALA